MLKFEVKNLHRLFDKISETQSLYMPLEKAGEADYGLYETGAKTALGVLKTVKSPKDLFFPQSETLMKFKTEGKSISVQAADREVAPFVLLGVKACDYKAFEVLDRVFLADPIDTYYQSKRNAATVVTLACAKPEESCFCKVFGIDAAAPLGDVTTWMDETYLYWNANTEKGEALTEQVRALAAEGGEDAVAAQQAKTREIIEKLPFSHLDLSYFKENETKEIFNREEWNELSEACLACGTCTFVCPTCQCFDIREFKSSKNEVLRYRCWDSCMYSDFTQMAGGNNRTTQMQRYRQRFMHKLVYYPENNDGLFSCVGCGRCVNKCPQKLNIVKVVKAMGGKKNG
ncbi:MAG: 4Fe-4S ferredoxin [Bacillota bacterium]|nr:MAG: 4Fe-4S ferredoxin [Bacillota bacterium]